MATTVDKSRMNSVLFSGLLVGYDLESGTLPYKQNEVSMRFIVDAKNVGLLITFLADTVDTIPPPTKAGVFKLVWEK